MDSQTNYEKLISVVADLSSLVIELTKRLEVLESKTNYDGVYLDGTPDYVREYIEKEGGKINGR
jgi:hypothetical protein